METIIVVVHLVVAVIIVGLVLLQQGKGADVGAAFGSGSSNTVFGSSGGATAMTRITTWLAIGFFVISFALAYTAKERSDQADRLGIPQVSAGIDEAEDLSLDLEPSADDSSEEIPEI